MRQAVHPAADLHRKLALALEVCILGWTLKLHANAPVHLLLSVQAYVYVIDKYSTSVKVQVENDHTAMFMSEQRLVRAAR